MIVIDNNLSFFVLRDGVPIIAQPFQVAEFGIARFHFSINVKISPFKSEYYLTFRQAYQSLWHHVDEQSSSRIISSGLVYNYAQSLVDAP